MSRTACREIDGRPVPGEALALARKDSVSAAAGKFSAPTVDQLSGFHVTSWSVGPLSFSRLSTHVSMGDMVAGAADSRAWSDVSQGASAGAGA